MSKVSKTSPSYYIVLTVICLSMWVAFAVSVNNRSRESQPAQPKQEAVSLANSDYIIDLDSNATIVGKLKNNPDVVNDMIVVARSRGWRCDTLSYASFWNGTFTLQCNNFNYEYEITDQGGRWVVEFIK